MLNKTPLSGHCPGRKKRQSILLSRILLSAKHLSFEFGILATATASCQIYICTQVDS